MQETDQSKKKKLVIIGGGFAGTTLARKLEKKMPKDWDIYLLSETNFVTYNPLLPEVVGASILPGHVQSPIRQILKRTRMRMVTVDKVDYKRKVVCYHNDEASELSFDQLVFAAGVQANMGMIEGMGTYSLPLKTVGDALVIRNKTIDCLEAATIHSNIERRNILTSFIIIGGGFSGVETAGELNDFLKSAQKYYKNIELENCKIFIIHGMGRLLPELSSKLGEKTEKLFRKRNIEIRLNTRVLGIEKETVILSDGSKINAGTIISTIGTKPHDFIQSKSLPRDKGRIVVSGDMSVSGHQGVWALGDCALVPNAYNSKLSPPTAQFADRQAKHLAKNILAYTNGNPTQVFSYKPMGMLASIGHNKAVAEIFGFRISGFIAFLMWRGIYLMKVPTLSRKVRLFLEWNWAMFFPPDIAHLGFKRTPIEKSKSKKE